MVDSAMMPHLAFIVDQRYAADYATVYAIAQIAVCFAYGFAPLVGAQIAELVGFRWLMSAIGSLNVAYCVLLGWMQRRQFLLPDQTAQAVQAEKLAQTIHYSATLVGLGWADTLRNVGLI